MQAYLQALDSDDAETLHKMGRRLKDLGELNGSLTAFRRALDKDPEHRVYREWQHRSAIASMLWLQDARDEAIAELGRITETPNVSWRTAVTRAMTDLVTAPSEVELLRDWLESVRPRDADRDALADFHEAVLGLAWVWQEPAAVRHEPVPALPRLLPVVTPVALEVHAGLLPEGEGWETEHPLFKQYAPQMRARIEGELGVRVPGVRVRTADRSTPSGTYTIFLDEVAEVTGTAVSGALFCASAEALAQWSQGKPALGTGVDPVTGRQGGWIAASNVKGALVANVDTYDHFQYMLRHVEAILRQRLEDFVGVQELENMLEVWQVGDESTMPSQEVVERILPDTAARLQLLQVLRCLVREQVPIRDLGTILNAFATRPVAGVSESHLIGIAEAIRLRLRESLPGNHAGSRFFYLAPAIEEEIDTRIRVSDGRVYLMLPPEHTKAILDVVRRAFADRPELGGVIVTRRDRIRPYVRRLIECDFPRVAVLSSQELLPHLRRTVSATINAPLPPTWP